LLDKLRQSLRLVQQSNLGLTIRRRRGVVPDQKRSQLLGLTAERAYPGRSVIVRQRPPGFSIFTHANESPLLTPKGIPGAASDYESGPRRPHPSPRCARRLSIFRPLVFRRSVRVAMAYKPRSPSKHREALWLREMQRAQSLGRGDKPICNLCDLPVQPGQAWHESHCPCANDTIFSALLSPQAEG
jgi:hypothetical protein